MGEPKLYRRRLIPNETVFLKNDKTLLINDEIIITKWETIKPRADFAWGYSCYFLKEGYKISRFLDSCYNTVYIYCDIIDYEFNKDENTYIFNDLLIDVVVENDGFVKVLDVGEVSVALREGLIDAHKVGQALLSLESLLHMIYEKRLPQVLDKIDSVVKAYEG